VLRDSVRERLSIVKTVTFPEPSLFVLVLGQGEGAWAHGMSWVCFMIMWSLRTRNEKSFSHSNLKSPYVFVQVQICTFYDWVRTVFAYGEIELRRVLELKKRIGARTTDGMQLQMTITMNKISHEKLNSETAAMKSIHSTSSHPLLNLSFFLRQG